MNLTFKQYYDLGNNSSIVDPLHKKIMKVVSSAPEGDRSVLENDSLSQEFKSKIEHTIHFLVSLDKAAQDKQLKGNFEQLYSNAQKWEEASRRRGQKINAKKIDGLEALASLGNGFTMYKLLTKEQCELEGTKMKHCVGGYDPTKTAILSLRDSENEPHATLEVDTNKNIKQLKGKTNGPVGEKYIPYVKKFLALRPDYNLVGDGDKIGFLKWEDAFYDPDSEKWKNIFQTKVLPHQQKVLDELRSKIEEE